MKKQIAVESAIERINYLSNLPIEERKKELKSIQEPNYKFPPKRIKNSKAIFQSKLLDLQFPLNLHKQKNGRITLDIPRKFVDRFKDKEQVMITIKSS